MAIISGTGVDIIFEGVFVLSLFYSFTLFRKLFLKFRYH